MKGITEKFKEINLKGMSLSEALALARENSQTVKKCILGLLLIICLVLFVFGGKDEEIEVEAASGGSGDILIEAGGGEIGTAEAGAAYGSALPAGEIFVDVQGAVENPGVVRLTEGARVFQAIEAAGGVVSMGDTSLLNLALRLNDGDKLYVPFAGESVTLADGTQVIAGSAASAAAGGAALISGSGDLGTQSGKININTATSEELQTLSGIGIVTAGKIVDYRSQNGRFAKPEDIKNVSGIGERTYESIKDDICV